MHIDPIIPVLCAVITVVLALAITLRRLNQPHVVAYILAGVLLGPAGMEIVGDLDAMSRAGSIGIMLLLFFVGMEVNLPGLLASWRVAVIGTLLQILSSIAVVLTLGAALGWSLNRSVLLGFVISLSSTAVVLRLLQQRGEIDSRVGQAVIGVLLVQDLALIPMLIVISLLAGDQPSPLETGLQVVGAIGLLSMVIWVLRRGHVAVPLVSIAGDDRELRLLVALLACFGLALVTGLLGLSSALGAFLAGVLATYSRQGVWIHGQLAPFRDLLVGAFFVSIGMMIDVEYLIDEWRTITVLVLAVLLTNTLINAVIIRLLGQTWRESWYGGAMLAQIGELSFLLAAVGLNSGMITDFAYQATVVTIALTLTLSPLWIMLFSRRRSGAAASTSRS